MRHTHSAHRVADLALRATLAIAACLFSNAAAAQMLEVGRGRQFATIQAAIDRLPLGSGAAAGYTVLVHPGTYAEMVRLPDGLSGTSTRPVVLRAALPARRPLDGGAWADDPSERSVIATPGTYGIYSAPTDGAQFLEINGFFFTGGSLGAIYMEERDADIWIRNNVAVNVGNSAGENDGGFTLIVVARALVQNNYWELSSTGGISSRNAFNHKGVGGIYEYNECALLSGVNGRGRCLYFHSSSAGTIVRYNFLRLRNTCPDNLCWRMRDSTNQQVHNNYVHSTAPQPHTWIHENTDAGLIENHLIQRNTWYYERGADGDFPVLGLSFLNNTTISRNLFVSGVPDGDTYPIGRGYTRGSYSLTLTDNVMWNYAALKDPGVGPTTESGTQRLDPGMTFTGCAATMSNDAYGANLDVGSVPFRRCDGGAFPVANKWATAPPMLPPAPPTNVRIIR